MQVCQNPNCSNPFNPDYSKFCIVCGHGTFGQLLRNRYRVLRLLGEGGFSKTYAAEDVDKEPDNAPKQQNFSKKKLLDYMNLVKIIPKFPAY
jgi:serine/threonine protein kinase